MVGMFYHCRHRTAIVAGAARGSNILNGRVVNKDGGIKRQPRVAVEDNC
jgi:hypothetical protein